jgi:hypothetical protein
MQSFKIIDDAPFRSHYEIEIAQSDVEIDHNNVLARPCRHRAERGRRGRFADAALYRMSRR